MALRSKLIFGVKPSAKALDEIRKLMPADAQGTPAGFMVFETEYNGEKYYCCLSGGKLQNGDILLTTVGRAACEALMNLPMGNDDKFIFQEVKMGKTPLREKVEETFSRCSPGTKICFVGDMQGELDGQMTPLFNLDGMIDISQ